MICTRCGFTLSENDEISGCCSRCGGEMADVRHGMTENTAADDNDPWEALKSQLEEMQKEYGDNSPAAGSSAEKTTEELMAGLREMEILFNNLGKQLESSGFPAQGDEDDDPWDEVKSQPEVIKKSYSNSCAAGSSAEKSTDELMSGLREMEKLFNSFGVQTDDADD